MYSYVLLNPGPVNTSQKVKKALLRGDLCHREKEFSEILLRVRSNLLNVFKLDEKYTAIFLTGSGTLALEASLVSTLNPSEKVLVLSNGIYGDRIGQIIQTHGFQKMVYRVPLGVPLQIEVIDEMLKADSQIDAVAMVHHETSTGMINPVEKIGQLKSMDGKRLIVDSISGLAGEPIDLIKGRIKVCSGTANKCIQGLPGVSFVLIEKEQLRKISHFPKRSLYLDLCGYWKEQELGGVPFTPSVQTFYALDTALEELKKEGISNRIERYRNYAERFRRGFEKLEISNFIDPRHHANTLTALNLPEGMTYEFLHDRLKDEGFVIYAGQGSLKNKIFRVANMGNLKLRDIDRFLKCLEKIIREKLGSETKNVTSASWLVTRRQRDKRRATSDET